jgi:hypothetical protein
MGISKKTIKIAALSLVAMAVLAGCGSSSKTPTPTPTPAPSPTPAPTPTSIALKVADGYLQSAFVFLDVNTNNIHDTDEPSGKTDNNGAVTLDTSDITGPENYPIVVIATKAETKDKDTGTFIAKDFSLSAPAGSQTVNPITTLIQTKIVKAKSEGTILKLADAIVAVATELGLTGATPEQMLGDYMLDKETNAFSSKIHALARSIVQLLPADAADLTEDLAEQNAALQSLATAILDAIAAGGDAEKITVIVKDGGVIKVEIPEVDDAKAFIADFRTWGAKIESELNNSSASFGDKAESAESIIDSQVDGLMVKVNDVLMIVETAVNNDSIADLKMADFANFSAIADTDGVTVTDFVETNTTMKGMVELNLQDDTGDIIKLMIDIDAAPVAGSTKSKGDLKISGTLANADASISLKSATINLANIQVATDTDDESLYGATVAFAANVEIESLKTNTGLFKGAVALNGKWVELSGDDDGAFVPTLASLSGSFGTGAELFDAMLKIESAGDYTLEADGNIDETENNWIDAKATLKVNVELANFSGATVDITVDRKSVDDGLVDATLTYGESKVVLSMNTSDETGTIKITNDTGILVTLETKNVADGDDVGDVYLGVKKVGDITLVGSVHKINYVDGSFETIF